jgi:hypothetical protein
MNDEAGAPDSAPDDPARAKRAQIDAILVEFRAAQHAAATSPAPVELPRRLHHYTTPEGLLGITSTSALWASDVRYLNDASELTYAAELVADVVGDVIADTDSDVLGPLLPDRRGAANPFEFGARPFVACFCEDEDLLSQWRGYRAGEVGYSLGFDLSLQAAAGGLPPNTYLRKVIYDAAEQRHSVGRVVDVWLKTADSLLQTGRGLAPDDLFPYPAIWALQEALAEHHLCFKHPTFAEEREWRLIKLVDVREELRLLDHRRNEAMLRATRQRVRELGVDMPEATTAWGQANAEGVEIRFRRSALGLVPYVGLQLRDPAGVFTGRLPLLQVIQGPAPNPDLALESLQMYLESCGYGFHTQVRASGIPLRS